MANSTVKSLADSKASTIIFECYYQFTTLLIYVEPESLKDDAQRLEKLASDESIEDAQLTSKVGHLFGKSRNSQVDLPERNPPWFPDINHRSWTREFWRRRVTKRDKLKRMVKRFKQSLIKAILLNRMIADLLLRYLVFIVYLEGPLSGEPAIVPLSDGSTAVGTREYYYEKLAKLGLQEGTIATIQKCLDEFLEVDSRPYTMNLGEYEVHATKQDTGESAGVSTLTNSHANGTDEKKEE